MTYKVYLVGVVYIVEPVITDLLHEGTRVHDAMFISIIYTLAHTQTHVL